MTTAPEGLVREQVPSDLNAVIPTAGSIGVAKGLNKTNVITLHLVPTLCITVTHGLTLD